MPNFRTERDILHFGAFKGHIGIFPSVREPELADRTAQYKGEKGSLQLTLDQLITFDLIADIVRICVRTALALTA